MKILDGPSRGRPRKDTTMSSMAIRLPDDLMAEIDDYQATLQQALPGISLSRSDAIRQLIAVGLRQENERLGK